MGKIARKNRACVLRWGGRFCPPYPPTGCPGLLQKLLHRPDEMIRLVMVDPMPGILHHDDPDILEMARTAVLLRIGGPAFLAVDEQRWTGDVRP